jgi:MATE family multidrug resistance protein
VRIGYHLGRGDVRASKAAMHIVVGASTASTVLIVGVLWPLRWQLCSLVTSDSTVIPVAAELVAAAFVAAGLSQLVSIGTSGVLSGQGRTVVTTLLSFGFELPASIGAHGGARTTPSPQRQPHPQPQPQPQTHTQPQPLP